MTKPNGGQAFPLGEYADNHGGSPCQGMTLQLADAMFQLLLQNKKQGYMMSLSDLLDGLIVMGVEG